LSAAPPVPESRDDGQSTLFGESADELYEDAPCGYISTAPDGMIQRVNRTFLALSGYDAAELVGRRRFYDLLPPGAKIYYETHYWPLLQMQESVREIALELIRADGSRLPILVNATLKRDADENPGIVRVTIFDASERRAYEHELLRARADAEHRAAAASALQHVAEGVVLLDNDGIIRATNPAAARVLGFAFDNESDERRLVELVPEWEAVAARIPVGGEGATAAAVIVPIAAGDETHWLAASAEAAGDGVVYTIRDVTAERRLEDVRDNIVAIVSHEIRTPLAGVYGAAQTLIAHGDALGDDQRTALVRIIAEQSARLARIVDEILLTQRLDTGDVPFARASFDLGELIGRVIEKTLTWRNQRPVQFARGESMQVEGDPARLEQALVNLLDNAMKYSPPGGEVDVRIERQRVHARVTVTDHGPGIPPADRERIFEKFLRLDPEQLSGVAGTGLGLYITRELVRRMHGQVGLLPSTNGATFFLTVPLAPKP
jgi:PAS domain S-box-containing protein